MSEPLTLATLDTLDVSGKTVLVRADLNVPMDSGRITDKTRLLRSLPTLIELSDKGAKVVVLSHFGRPKGKFVPSLSLAPLVDALSAAMPEKTIRFGVDCIGNSAREAVAQLQKGEILLLENLRFHPEEVDNDPDFTKELAALGDLYINDTFSCSHRSHASITGIPKHLPFAAGRLLQQEVESLGDIFNSSERPLAAIVGGSKISTKLGVLQNLVKKMQVLIVGGAMANTFLHAQGIAIGNSLYEPDMEDTALSILKTAEEHGCNLVLPVDAIVAETLTENVSCSVCAVNHIPPQGMILDVGPKTVHRYMEVLSACKTIVWNGPIGAFETSPFDASTVQLARILAALTAENNIKTVAGGGDTVSAVSHAGLEDGFTYLSTAGGAFLEWLKGEDLPGITILSCNRPAA